jgi:peptidoglycan-associated lipoprotein
MPRLLRFGLIVLFVMGVGACSKTGKGGSQGSDQSLSDQDLALAESQRWADGGSIPQAQAGGVFKDVHFDYDSSAVSAQYQSELKKNAELIRTDPTLRVEIEGHCDRRGTTDYNMALGERRAGAVGALLISFGAPAAQLSTVSYGEEVPLDPAETEEAYAKNRRVHFAVSRWEGRR